MQRNQDKVRFVVINLMRSFHFFCTLFDKDFMSAYEFDATMCERFVIASKPCTIDGNIDQVNVQISVIRTVPFLKYENVSYNFASCRQSAVM